jgi:hypothetical protein
MLSFLDRFDAAGFPSACREIDLLRRKGKDVLGFYAIVGLPPDATDEEIKSAFRKELRRFHPDGTEPDREKFEQVEAAYRTLTQDRVNYDAMEEVPEEEDDDALTPEEWAKFQDIVEESGQEYVDEMIQNISKEQNGWSYYSLGPGAELFDIAQEWYEIAVPFLADHGFSGHVLLCLVPGLQVTSLDGCVLMVPAERPRVSLLAPLFRNERPGQRV